MFSLKIFQDRTLDAKKTLHFFIVTCLGIFWLSLSTQASTPQELAESEVDVWKSYYAQDPQALEKTLPKFLSLHYKTSNAQEVASSYARVLMAFSRTPQDAEKETYTQTTLPSLMDFFETLKGSSSLKFSPKDVASAELTWWIARRGNAKEHAPQNIGLLMQTSYACLYGGRMEDYQETGLMRAKAARLRDTYWEENNALTEENWKEVLFMLTNAYARFPHKL